MRWTTSIRSAPNGSPGWVAGMRGGPSSRTPANPPKSSGSNVSPEHVPTVVLLPEDLVEVYAFFANHSVEKEWVPPRGSRLPQEHQGDGEDHSVRCSSDPAEQSVGHTHSTRTPQRRNERTPSFQEASAFPRTCCGFGQLRWIVWRGSFELLVGCTYTFIASTTTLGLLPLTWV